MNIGLQYEYAAFLTMFIIDNLSDTRVGELALKIQNCKNDSDMQRYIDELKILYVEIQKEKEKFSEVSNKYFE
jgi:hypothetical protein